MYSNILGIMMMEIKAQCYQTLDKEVKSQTNAGVIYVPKAWAGKKVRILLLEPLEEEAKRVE